MTDHAADLALFLDGWPETPKRTERWTPDGIAEAAYADGRRVVLTEETLRGVLDQLTAARNDAALLTGMLFRSRQHVTDGEAETATLRAELTAAREARREVAAFLDVWESRPLFAPIAWVEDAAGAEHQLTPELLRKATA